MNETKIAKRLSYLICIKLCKKILTNDECRNCEIALLINQLAFPGKR